MMTIEGIEDHLKTVTENSHNAIGGLNEQIIINSYFNDTLGVLKNAIEHDRTIFNEIDRTNIDILKHMLFNDQMYKLKSIEGKINLIQDSIAAARHGLMHPSILTSEEIEKFEIDFIKLKWVRVGVLTYAQNSLIIVIKIPRTLVNIEVKLVTALPNNESLEIMEEDELITSINQTIFTYK